MSTVQKNIYALIFAGGGGTRLWPLSTEDKPKQFLKLFSDKTLLQETFDRAKHLVSADRIFVATTKDYVKRVKTDLPGLKRENILEEPTRRGTGPAIFLSALTIGRRNPKAIIVNMWADHKIDDWDSYAKTILAGAEVVSDGKNLLTTGLIPAFAHTGLGYIKKGSVVGKRGGFNVFKVGRFTEKPETKTAQAMVDSGEYLWNVGLFIWRADAVISSFERHAPRIAGHKRNFVKGLESGNAGLIDRAYRAMPDISIDNAIAEKVKNFLVIESTFGWSDVGDFEAVWEVSKKDGEGNVAPEGKWIGLDTQGSLVISESRQLIATVGVRNVAVVATEEAVLVIPKDQSQKAKDVLEVLKKKKLQGVGL